MRRWRVGSTKSVACVVSIPHMRTVANVLRCLSVNPCYFLVYGFSAAVGYGAFDVAYVQEADQFVFWCEVKQGLGFFPVGNAAGAQVTTDAIGGGRKVHIFNSAV